MLVPEKGLKYSKNRILSDKMIEVLDELNIGAFTVDLNRKITSINYAALALMGNKRSELIGQDCREIFLGVPCMVTCLVSGKDDPLDKEPDVLVANEEGTRHLLTRLATPIYDFNRNLTGCLTILQDHRPVAELIDRIHYEERSLKIILDSLDVGIFSVNQGGYITFFNKEAEKISGYDRKRILGKKYTVLFEPDTAKEFGSLIQAIAKGVTINNHRLRMLASNGEPVPIRVNYMALKNEKRAVIGGLAVFHDLTLLRRLKQAISNQYTFHDMIGKDPEMANIFEKVNVVAKTDATVLIEGSTGTGKDLLAKVIHHSSPRSKNPFVKVNCAAIPDNLLESEMFGYAKGAFTGAAKDKPGRFNEADGGTLFLDEIGDLPLSLQGKLLRVLEDMEFYPLGSRKTQKVDVRIIAATNRDLAQRVEKRLFRQDLYYRLNVFCFKLPDLKARRIDLPILIRHILRRLCIENDNRRVRVSEQAMERLLSWEYPGNVRELENILEHALVICPGDTILPKHLPDYMLNRFPKPVSRRDSGPAATPDGDAFQAEGLHLHQMLRRHGGNRSRTAKALGIDRSTLWRKLKKHGISGNSDSVRTKSPDSS
ncbi:MAG: sigma 54-interacting transcriptional regulator [Deltaproteobacteria bacterium]|nr:sigma 54-interacting transcriptional regulator [Deltaproteobacteria bacterium]MBW2131496.1 sigma 54-interacting transcriptional regulator [Deltaproteobacteria bacterium]